MFFLVFGEKQTEINQVQTNKAEKTDGKNETKEREKSKYIKKEGRNMEMKNTPETRKYV
jgi:hypothetical protein